MVSENDKLKVQLDNAHEEIGRLRKQLLTIGMGALKTDANGRLLVSQSPKAHHGIPLNLDIDPDDDEGEGQDEDDFNEEEEEYMEEEGEDDDNDNRKSIVGNRKRRNSSKFQPPPLQNFQRYGGPSQHKANKKSFMSTAPLSAFLPK